MYEGGGAPLRGMWRWFENFNQFVSMLQPGPGVCWPDWSYLEWWSQPHTSCLTTRDLNRACQAPSQSPHWHCKVCKEVHCRVSPPLLSGDMCWRLRGSEIGSLIKLSGLSLGSHAALTVLGHTGRRERIRSAKGKWRMRDWIPRPGAGSAVICAQCHSWLGLFMINFLRSSLFAEISSK